MKKLFGDYDKFLFWFTMAVVAIALAVGIAMPDQFAGGINVIFTAITVNLGWWYVLTIATCIIVVLYFAFSKYGKLKLGKESDVPEYSSFSWFAMLFSCGIGVGFIFWGVGEPMYYFRDVVPYSPFPVGDIRGAAFAIQVSILHWGVHGWITYAVVGLAICYYSYRKGRPMTVANALYGVLGERVNGFWGTLIDFLASFATFCGIATSLGMALMSMSFALNKSFGVEITTTLLVVINLVIIAAFVLSAASGIDRGIKYLSNTNMIMAFCVLTFVLFVGPTRYVLHLMTDSMGNYLQNFIFMTFFPVHMILLVGWVRGQYFTGHGGLLGHLMSADLWRGYLRVGLFASLY